MSDTGSNEKIPFMQQLLDSPFLLLAIGILSPMVLYILWGVMEVIATPIAQ
ncbi:MAG: hypothetical protein ISR45_07220 [Rhodospirillales bacterium]|nr:hypothetical protein [Rhodospirillales bacterium]